MFFPNDYRASTPAQKLSILKQERPHLLFVLRLQLLLLIMQGPLQTQYCVLLNLGNSLLLSLISLVNEVEPPLPIGNLGFEDVVQFVGRPKVNVEFRVIRAVVSKLSTQLFAQASKAPASTRLQDPGTVGAGKKLVLVMGEDDRLVLFARFISAFRDHNR